MGSVGPIIMIGAADKYVPLMAAMTFNRRRTGYFFGVTSNRLKISSSVYNQKRISKFLSISLSRFAQSVVKLMFDRSCNASDIAAVSKPSLPCSRLQTSGNHTDNHSPLCSSVHRDSCSISCQRAEILLGMGDQSLLDYWLLSIFQNIMYRSAQFALQALFQKYQRARHLFIRVPQSGMGCPGCSVNFLRHACLVLLGTNSPTTVVNVLRHASFLIGEDEYTG